MSSICILLTSLLFVVARSGPILAGQDHHNLEANYFDQESSAIIVDNPKALDEEYGNLNDQLEDGKCDKYKCFSPLQCEISERKKILYYIYPPLTFLDSFDNLIYSTRSMITREYWQTLETILSSSRVTLNPGKACLFVPSIDLAWLGYVNSSLLATIYNSLPYWRHVDGRAGTNHLVISLNPSLNVNQLSTSIGQNAIIVSSNHDSWTLRPEFDYSIPMLMDEESALYQTNGKQSGQWKLISTQYNSLNDRLRLAVDNLERQMQGNFLVLGHQCQLTLNTSKTEWSDGNSYLRCANNSSSIPHLEMNITKCRCSKDGLLDFNYPQVLSVAQFCLILYLRTDSYSVSDSSQYLLVQAMKHGCVPIVSSDIILPYHNLLDWSQMSISLTNEVSLNNIAPLISSTNINSTAYQRMSSRAQETWLKYFRYPEQLANILMLHYDSLVYPKKLS